MNFETIRYRFSLFLKQFRIEDLKLLMKFLELIVNEYKNSKASRLFDLLSNESDDFDIQEIGDLNSSTNKLLNPTEEIPKIENEKKTQIILDQTTNVNQHNKNNFQQLNNLKIQNEKLRRLKLLKAKRKLLPALVYTTNTTNNHNNNINVARSLRPMLTLNNDINKTKQSNSNIKIDSSNNSNEVENSKVNANDSTDKNKNTELNNNNNNNRGNKSADVISSKKHDEFGCVSPHQVGVSSSSNMFSIEKLNMINRRSYSNDLKEPEKTLNEPNTILRHTHLSLFNPSLYKCIICSDLASDTSLGPLACKSCVEFFKCFSLTKPQQLNCVNPKLNSNTNKPNKCEITKQNRNLCNKCRWDKCIKSGFKLDASNPKKQLSDFIVKKKQSEENNIKIEINDDDDDCMNLTTNGNTNSVDDSTQDTEQINTNKLKMNSSTINKSNSNNKVSETNDPSLAKTNNNEKSNDSIQYVEIQSSAESHNNEMFYNDEYLENSNDQNMDDMGNESVKSGSLNHSISLRSRSKLNNSTRNSPRLNNSSGSTTTKRVCLDKTPATTGAKLNESDLSIRCSVCSDYASGTRYGVCVCEGCKEFFRRQRENITNINTLPCVNGTNDCEINVSNRTQCRKCRFDKCIKLGMKLTNSWKEKPKY